MRERLDVLLVERGLFATRAQARAAVLAGEVTRRRPRRRQARHPDRRRRRAGRRRAPPLRLARRRQARHRHHASRRRRVDGEDVCDLGSSTGGFVDRLLQGGAARVIAVDVGYGQLDWKLREDPRVTVLERTNARQLTRERLPFAPSFVTADLSFISLTVALGPVLESLRAGFRGLVLVKPQFEAGRERVGKGGVVRDPAVHRDVLEQVAGVAPGQGARRSWASATPAIRDRKATWSTSSYFCDGGAPPEPAVAAGAELVAARGRGRPWLSRCAASPCSRTSSREATAAALAELAAAADRLGLELLMPADEAAKHPSRRGPRLPDGRRGGAARRRPVPRVRRRRHHPAQPLGACSAAGAHAGRQLRQRRLSRRAPARRLAGRPRDHPRAATTSVIDLLTVDVQLNGAAPQRRQRRHPQPRRAAPRAAARVRGRRRHRRRACSATGSSSPRPRAPPPTTSRAAGPIVEWNAGVLVLNFIAPHSLGFRPVVLRPDHVISARNVSPLQEAEVVADGDVVGRPVLRRRGARHGGSAARAPHGAERGVVLPERRGEALRPRRRADAR